MFLSEEEYLALLGRLDSLEKKKLKVEDLPLNDIASQIQDQADWKGADVLLRKSVTNALLKDGSADSRVLADDAVGTAETAQVPMVKLTHSAATATVNVVAKIVSYDTEIFDTDTMHDAGSPTRITIKTAGKYLLISQGRWAGAAGGLREVSIKKNGANLVADDVAGPAANEIAQIATTVVDCAVNDYFETQIYQSSGGALNFNAAADYTPIFIAVWLSK